MIPARIIGFKETGGRVELVLNQIQSKRRATALISSNKPVQIGAEILVGKGIKVLVEGCEDNLFRLLFPEPGVLAIASEWGEVPLPPYIKKPASKRDRNRYQTVYAKVDGAVAAPTAGLHFDDNILKEIDKKGINREEITLHVGAGTFYPCGVITFLIIKCTRKRFKLAPEYVTLSIPVEIWAEGRCRRNYLCQILGSGCGERDTPANGRKHRSFHLSRV